MLYILIIFHLTICLGALSRSIYKELRYSILHSILSPYIDVPLFNQLPTDRHLHCLQHFGIPNPAAMRPCACILCAGRSAGKFLKCVTTQPWPGTKLPVCSSQLFWQLSSFISQRDPGDWAQNFSFSNLTALLPSGLPISISPGLLPGALASGSGKPGRLPPPP